MTDPQQIVPSMFRFEPNQEIPGSHDVTEVEHLMVKIAKNFTDLLKMTPCIRGQNLDDIAQRPDIDPAMRTAVRRPRVRIANTIIENYLKGNMPLINDIRYTKFPSAFIDLVPELREFKIDQDSVNQLSELWSGSKWAVPTLIQAKRTADDESSENSDTEHAWPPPLPPIRHAALRKQVFTHRSANNPMSSELERRNHNNERLEFKGDTVLGGIVVDLIYHKFPSYREGDLSKLKSRLVCNKLLQELAISYDLPRHLFCSDTVRKAIDDAIKNGTDCKFIADLFEAYIGGVEVDLGFQACRVWLEKVYEPLIKQEIILNSKSELDKNAKAELYRLIGADLHRIDYIVKDLGNGQFESRCTVDDEVIGYGIGSNKRDASSAAAMDAMSNKEAICKYSELRIAAKLQRKKARELKAKIKAKAAAATGTTEKEDTSEGCTEDSHSNEVATEMPN